MIKYKVHAFNITAMLLSCRNYGGVYVGLPADLTTVATSQSKSTRKGKHSLEEEHLSYNSKGQCLWNHKP